MTSLITQSKDVNEFLNFLKIDSSTVTCTVFLLYSFCFSFDKKREQHKRPFEGDVLPPKE